MTGASGTAELSKVSQPPVRNRILRRLGWPLYFSAIIAASVLLYCLANPGWVAFRIGENALARGDYKSALENLTRARDLGVTTRHSAVQLASVLLTLDRPREAAEILEPYRREIPPDSAATSLLAGIYAAEQRPADAVHVFLDAIESGLAPDPRAALQLGDLYRQLDRYTDAEIWYHQVIAQGSPEIQLEARARMAEVRAWTGDYPAALAEIDDILAADPDNRQIRMLRARVLSWAGRNKESAEEYRKLLTP